MRSKYLLWLGVGVLGTSLMVGCRHGRRCACETSICCPSSSVVVVPSSTPTETLSPAVHTLPPAKKENVQLTAVAPGASQSGAVAGTIELTAAEADAMGIKPGYTPGALYVPGSASGAPIVHAIEPKNSEPPVVEERRSEPVIHTEPATPAPVPVEAPAPSMPAVEEKHEQPVLEVPAATEKPSESQQ